MNELFNFVMFTQYRHPDPANDPDIHEQRIEAAREQLGARHARAHASSA